MNTVSVIIPLFNKQPYFQECLDALVQQSIQPTEIIVIDDGSTDGSRELAHRFAQKFESLPLSYHVIEQDHRGVSTALNRGIDAATSTFVTRVDADDLVSPYWLETMLAQDIAHKPVHIRCCHQRIAAKTRLSSAQFDKNEHQPRKEASPVSEIEPGNILYGRLFNEINTNLMSACGMLYVLEELKSKHIDFCIELDHTEDLLFNATLFAHNTPHVLVNEPLYFYRQVAGSLSKAPSSLFPAITTLELKLDELSHNKETATVARAHVSDVLHYLCWYYSIALLEEEKNRTQDPSYRDRVEKARAISNMDEVFKKATDKGVAAPMAARLYSLLINKQYAQLQLAARTINLARNARRFLKLHTSS